MYESYRNRVKNILNKLPKGITVHYTDKTGKKHTVGDNDFLLTLITANKAGEKGIIKEIDPVDLTALQSKSLLFTVLLTVDGYKPAYSITVHDPVTGETRELSDEEEDELDRQLGAMSEEERAEYWRKEEKFFIDHFMKGGEE